MANQLEINGVCGGNSLVSLFLIYLGALLETLMRSILSWSIYKGGIFRHYSQKSMLFNNFIACNFLLEVNNSSFLHCFNSYFVTHLSKICSDHSPLLITARSQTPPRAKLFGFENYWLEYPQCHSVVKLDWDSNLILPTCTLSHIFLVELGRISSIGGNLAWILWTKTSS